MSLNGLAMDQSPGDRLGRLLFHPASVALVGASDDKARTTGRPLSYLRRADFRGTVYPVNRNRERVQDERAWPSLTALPEVPEHVYVMTPTDLAVNVVQECVELGVPLVTVLADGFAEGGQPGLARTKQLRKLIDGSATRVVGPSSLGVVNLRNGLMLTANAVFAEVDPLVGDILAVSQSGSMIGTLVSRSKALGLGFASLVSVGNEVDLNVGEICAATLADPGIRGYALFLESISGAGSLRRFAAAAAKAGRPVVAYKLGRSSAGAELAQSHTGALAGEDEVSTAFLADSGIVRVRTLDGLIEAVSLARRIPAAVACRRPRIGVVTSTGGGAAMVVDQLGVLGIDVEPPSAHTFAKLAERGAPVRPARIVDLTLDGARYEVMRAALETLTEAREHDVLIAVVGSSALLGSGTAIRPIIELADTDVPVATFLAPDAPLALVALTAAGVPCFRTPESCADAVSAIFFRRLREVAETAAPGHVDAAARERTVDEETAYHMLDAIGVPRSAAVIIPGDEIKQLPFDYPVVAKVLSGEIPHKTDVGGVVLDIADADGLRESIRAIRASVAGFRPDLGPLPIIVEPMYSGLAEVLIGYRIDPQVGPIVLVAAGGELAEIYADRSLRLAPVDLATARDMIAEVRSLRILEGFRRRPAADIEALAQAIVSVSRLVERPEVIELEVNPLLVHAAGQGVVAVDTLARVREVDPDTPAQEEVPHDLSADRTAPGPLPGRRRSRRPGPTGSHDAADRRRRAGGRRQHRRRPGDGDRRRQHARHAGLDLRAAEPGAGVGAILGAEASPGSS
jgi:acetate---CoA ligase (ADP-forming)